MRHIKKLAFLFIIFAMGFFSYASEITPFKFTEGIPDYNIPSGSIFKVDRPDKDAPQITYYLSKPQAESFPLVVLCGGSSTKQSIYSSIHFHRYFLQECIDLNAGVLSVEQWGVEGSKIELDDWFSHYTRSQRLKDHQSVIDHLLQNPIEGWNGKLIFIGVSEGGPLVTSLTEAYSDQTLATINWSGAGDFGWDEELWAFAQPFLQADPPCPHGSKLSECDKECSEMRFLLSSKESFLQLMQSTINDPSTAKDFFGMSYKYHADALTYPKPNYPKLKTPYLVVAGAKDTTIETAEAFVEKAKQAGCPLTYMRIEDMDHYVRKRPEVIKASFEWLEKAISN